MIKQVQPNVVVRTEAIPTDAFEQAVLDCSDLLTNTDDRVVVNFGGGPQELYLALATATLAHPDRGVRTLQFSDLDSSVSEIPLPRLIGDCSEAAVDTLIDIIEACAEIGIPALADRSTHAKSTVSRHVQQLESIGAVTAEMHDKTKMVRPTLAGRIRLQRAASAD